MKSFWQPAISAALLLSVALSVCLISPQPSDAVPSSQNPVRHPALTSGNIYDTCQNLIAGSGRTIVSGSGRSWETTGRDLLASHEKLKALLSDFLDAHSLDSTKAYGMASQLDAKITVFTYDTVPQGTSSDDAPVTYLFIFCNDTLVIWHQVIRL